MYIIIKYNWWGYNRYIILFFQLFNIIKFPFILFNINHFFLSKFFYTPLLYNHHQSINTQQVNYITKNMFQNSTIIFKKQNNIFQFLKKFYFILFYKNNFNFKNNNFNFSLLNKIYMYKTTSHVFSYDVVNLYNRWTTLYWILYNIFYYDNKILIFGTYEYRKEIFALNWNKLIFTWNLWQYIQWWFILKTNRYNKQTRLFFKQLLVININILIFLNIFYHFRLINSIKYSCIQTIGLVPITFSINFYLLSIIIFELSFYIQFYFLYFLIFIKKYALSTQYLQYFKLWIFNKQRLYYLV